MILAPSNPELHFPLAEKILPFGKTTYVDKTFAPDVATAKKIFELADRHKAAIQTTSALRYTGVQEYVRDPAHGTVKHMITWGGGSSFAEYAIHPVELMISCMGPEARGLMRRGSGPYSQLLIDFSDDRTGVVNVYTQGDTPFAASVATEKDTKLLNVDLSSIFVNNASAVADLFESGKPNIDRRETLMIRRILDAADDPAARERFIDL
jgi:predicted dehydrogenase